MTLNSLFRTLYFGTEWQCVELFIIDWDHSDPQAEIH